LPKARRDGKTARHSARFYALRAARCADGSRPIPTTIPETDFPAYARLPYTAGPGMPGPYGTAAIKNACSQNKKARSLFAGENALNLC